MDDKTPPRSKTADDKTLTESKQADNNTPLQNKQTDDKPLTESKQADDKTLAESKQTDDKNQGHKSKKPKGKKNGATGWVITAFLLSFSITAVLSAASEKVVEMLHVAVSGLVLIAVMSLGILFDIIGLAVATADIKPFNAMAAKKSRVGKKGVWLIKNASKVSSFCNDIVGDIAGVVSGATGAGIAAKLFSDFGAEAFFPTLCLTSLIAACTVGFKAMGKGVAMKYSRNIVTIAAKILCGFRK